MIRLRALLAPISGLRSVVIVLTACMLWGVSAPQWLTQIKNSIDNTLFQLANGYRDIADTKTQITVVHVPDVEYERWLSDLVGAPDLQSLLSKAELPVEPAAAGEELPPAKPAMQALFGFILDRPLSLIKPESEALLEDIFKGLRTKDFRYNESKAVIERRETLTGQLHSEKIVLGIERAYPVDAETLGENWGMLQQYPPWLRHWLWKDPAQVSGVSLNPSPVMPHYPLFANEGIRQPLVRRNEKSNLLSFELKYFSKQMGVDKGKWLRDSGINLGDEQIPVSTAGELVPLYGQQSGVKASIRQITLTAALGLDSLDGWVLIGRDSSPSLERAAQNLAALGDGAYLFEPAWWVVNKKLLILIFALLLIFIVPRIKAVWLLAVSLIVFAALASTMFAAQLVNRLWLPAADLMIFWFAAAVLLMVARWHSARLLKLQDKADDFGYRYAKVLLSTGKSAQALEALRNCSTREPILEMLYTLGSQYENRGQFIQAIETLNEIKKRKRRYKDVPHKIKALNSKASEQKSIAGKLSASSSSKLAGSPSKLDSTQALPKQSPAKTTLGRYELKQELGRGATGTVYLAFDPKIARSVAIKTLNYQQFEKDDLEDIKARFYREARAVGRLSHPNIVQVFDVGEESGLSYFAMDYAKGHPLSDFISGDKLLPVPIVYKTVIDIGEALSYAHSHNVVHRDIKPANVMYNEDPFQIKVMDFGIARLVDHSQTSTGEILGSPLYMAPEQLQGKRVEPTSDIFSLGVMFYQLLTGVAPFQGENLANLTYEIIHTKHQSVRSHRKELPSSATRITNIALQKKPGDRFSSAAEMVDALKKALKRDFPSEVKDMGIAI